MPLSAYVRKLGFETCKGNQQTNVFSCLGIAMRDVFSGRQESIDMSHWIPWLVSFVTVKQETM
jgi:hypothetical protein